MEKELEHRTGTGSHLSLRSREEDARSHRRGRWRRNLSTGLVLVHTCH